MGNLGKSPHCIIHAVLDTSPSRLPSKEKILDYSKADFSGIKNRLSLDWYTLFKNNGAEHSWLIFKEKLATSIEACIPLKDRRSQHRPLWMNTNAMRIIRKKRRLWRKYKSSSDHADYTAYLQIQKLTTKIIRGAKKKLERKLAKNMKKNPRQFYSYMNSNTKAGTQVGPLQDGDKLVSDSHGICNVLNKQFVSVFTQENTSTIPSIPKRVNTSIGLLLASEENVKERLCKVKKHSAPGPDKFTPRVLSELSDVISLPLTLIFNKSLLSGEIPLDWRIAHVTPIYKKGNRAVAENYRPISLTSIICKILERMICEIIMTHLLEHNLLNSSQHGFMARRSCLTNLLEYLETVTSLLDNGHSVDVVYLDFSKAFDRVPHKRLLAKIASFGITGSLFNWIKVWLSDRKQRVVLNGCQSDWSAVPSGVPQGSVLGPLLFILFINDIDNAVDTVHFIMLKFADDTKGIHKVDSVEDAVSLQKNLDSLFRWSSDWQLLFNFDKCHILHFGENNCCFGYTMNGTPLLCVEEEKDLGVLISNCCTPGNQVSSAATKANQVLGQLLRSFTYRDRYTFVNLFKRYVRPQLEYCVQAWNPWLRTDIELLENVQKRAIRAVSGLSGSYEEKLAALKLPSLEARRMRGDLIEVFKIIHGFENVNASKFFTFASENHCYATRASTVVQDGKSAPSLDLAKKPFKLDIRGKFFSQRVINAWNGLPYSLKCATSVNQFKNRYDKL